MSETFRNFSGKIPETFGAWRGLGIGIVINDYIYDCNTFIAYCWLLQVAVFLGNNQRNELHSVIFTALQTKVTRIAIKYVSKCGHCSKIWRSLTGSLFRGIIPEKHRYFSGNFRKISGNFRTHNPSCPVLGYFVCFFCQRLKTHLFHKSSPDLLL